MKSISFSAPQIALSISRWQHRRHGKFDAGQIDALSTANLAAGDHDTLDAVIGNRLNSQANFAVSQHDSVARLQFIDQPLVAAGQFGLGLTEASPRIKLTCIPTSH